MTLEEFFEKYSCSNWMISIFNGVSFEEAPDHEELREHFGDAEASHLYVEVEDGCARIDIVFRKGNSEIGLFTTPMYIDPSKVDLPDFVKAEIALHDIDW